MKRSILLPLFILAASVFAYAQDQKTAAPAEFTKAELLAFPDVKALLSAINKGQDYSKFMVRNFNLVTVPVGTGPAVPVSKMGPGGVWSTEQKAMIEQYAQMGVVFTIEKIIMIESGKKGMIDQPSVSFSIKE